MFTNIINQYKNQQNFTHKITTKFYEANSYLPGYTENSLLINYTSDGVYVSHYYLTTSTNPSEFLFSTGLTYTIIDAETGEILANFYGFNNPDFLPFLDSLIAGGIKFDISDRKYGGSPKQLMHGRYKRLKSGKWRKEAA